MVSLIYSFEKGRHRSLPAGNNTRIISFLNVVEYYVLDFLLVPVASFIGLNTLFLCTGILYLIVIGKIIYIHLYRIKFIDDIYISIKQTIGKFDSDMI